MTQPQATRTSRPTATSSRRAPKAPILRTDQRVSAPSASPQNKSPQSGSAQGRSAQNQGAQSKGPRSTSQSKNLGDINLNAATAGATARVLNPLSSPLGSEAAPSRARTPLSLVRSQPGRRRAPFVVFCFLALVAAMATVLVLNISVSSGQYELVQLNNKKDTLVKQNQVLTQQVQNAQAPQNLVKRAQQLGMVAANTTGQINVDTQTIAGSPAPATAQAKPMPLIAAPEIGGMLPASATTTGTEASSKTTSNAAPLAASADLGSAPFSSSYTPAPETAPAAQTVSQPDLHGGTIPSPEQKTPNQN
ncbi:hypothetical protein FHU41_000183 [Psychromicrobium silvestre]|uniref:Cell division protein FtsL n=1 Tax=Psychromicrobium silvestre TaxID=1645614 RepID=A0A7Y9LQY0_9MICC|nr:hypothetical protein [Psychromicrobium silvestre]NYE93962.1 hypothetical protein [Psychromicrobium silvestre]